MDIRNYLDKIKERIGLVDETAVAALADELANAYKDEKMVFVIGNGGSAANASHFAQDLAKGVFLGQPDGKRLKALSLTDNTPYITALGNDDGYETVFASQLLTFGKEGDYLVAISGSGNSPNIIRAVEMAKSKNIKVIGITGYDGGALRKQSDFSLHIPLNEMCSVESIHSVIFHAIILALREKLANINFDESVM